MTLSCRTRFELFSDPIRILSNKKTVFFIQIVVLLYFYRNFTKKVRTNQASTTILVLLLQYKYDNEYQRKDTNYDS